MCPALLSLSVAALSGARVAHAAATNDFPGICESPDASRRLSAVRGGQPCPSGASRVRVAGVNIYDALWMGSSGMSAKTYNDSLAALEAAAESGVRVFRFFGSLWRRYHAFWVTQQATFWDEFDRLMGDVDRLGLYAILSIGDSAYHEIANSVTPGLEETVNDWIRNRSSKAWSLEAEYFSQIVQRYTGLPCVLMWELGNELNLLVNLPAESCGGEPCFDTDDLVSHETALVDIIRKYDPVRPVSSGHSAGRPSQWHMEHCRPEGQAPPGACDGPGNGFWGLDTKEQWLEIEMRQSAAVDIVSLHSYAGGELRPCYFDAAFCTGDFAAPGGALIQAVVEELQARSSAGGPSQALFVGEYGGPAPNFTGPTKSDQVYPAAVLKYQAALRDGGGAAAEAAMVFPLTAIWAWECPSHRSSSNCIWPNSTRPEENGSNRMLARIAAANAEMQKQTAGVESRLLSRAVEPAFVTVWI